MSGLIATQGQGDVWTWAATVTHVWVSGLTQPQSLLVSLTPDMAKREGDRTVQS